jgi:eukaryotic translation initiation factor 2C
MSHHRSNPPTKQLSELSLDPTKALAVDRSALKMDRPVPIPRPDPKPSNKIDSKSLKTFVERSHTPGLQAEFPLRQTFARPDGTLYTNHFAINLNPKIPLYEYNITGLPPKISTRTTKMLVGEAIGKIPFLQDNPRKFATDYKEKLISWIEIPNVAPVSVQTDDTRTAIDIGLHYVGRVDTELLQRYSQGRIVPTEVRSLS